MEPAKKDPNRELLAKYGHLKPSFISKLPHVVILMIIELVLTHDNMCFPDAPNIIEAFETEAEMVTLLYSVDYFTKNVRKARLDHDSVDKFPQLALEEFLKGKGFENKPRPQFVCEPFGLGRHFVVLNITHLDLSLSINLAKSAHDELTSVSETNTKALAAKLKKHMMIGKTYELNQYFVYLAGQLKDLRVTRGLFTRQTTRFQVSLILQFLRQISLAFSAKKLLKFVVIDIPSNNKAFMKDSDDTLCKLMGGVSLIFGAPSKRTYIEGNGVHSDDVVTEAIFTWEAAGGLKMNVPKINNIMKSVSKKSGTKAEIPRSLRRHFGETLARVRQASLWV
ncbi:uncharacterized protein EAF02_011527 [Botrytis sinoallii]|uniref:uncharacterized protein n=1 Tax=Botrytis sinoallii TaxID=1463999 RepID=UPI0019002242|nr:uncharacterized protein EAF02_011527 [Botrytis sinoallii]KAF7855268.1 hypothetical protein EAF02_011527 [Botrytis sinoallii]